MITPSTTSRIKTQFKPISHRPKSSKESLIKPSPSSSPSSSSSESLTILKQLFTHYSSNESSLNSTNYLKLMSDAKLIDKSLNKKYSEILFFNISKTKNTIDFQSFLEIILKLAELKYQNEYIKDQSVALNKLLMTYFEPLVVILYNGNNSSSGIGTNWKLLISRINSEGNRRIIEDNYLFFYQLYQKYFCFEHLSISQSQKLHLSQRAMQKLYRDFQVCPNYISISKLNEIFQQCLLNSEVVLQYIGEILGEIMIKMNGNIGNVFTLFHLMISFYLISACNLLITNENNDMVIFVDENDTLAFSRLIVNVLKYNSINEIVKIDLESNATMTMPTTMPMRTPIVNNIDSNSSERKNNSVLLKSIQSTQLPAYKPLANDSHDLTFIPRVDLNQVLTIDEIAEQVFNKYESILLNIYKFYSELFYEVSFSVFMAQKGFIKFIQDIGLAMNKEINNIPNMPNITSSAKSALQSKIYNNLLSFPSINLIFSKFSYNSKAIKKYSNDSNKRITFSSFMHIILCLANKLYNPDFTSIAYNDKLFNMEYLTTGKYPLKYFYAFIENYLMPLYSDIRNFIEDEGINLTIVQMVFGEEKIRRVIDSLMPSMRKIIMCYTDGKDKVSYEQFNRFLAEFEIFPDLINRAKMSRVFINFIEDFDRKHIVKGDNNILLGINMSIKAIMFIAMGSNVDIENYRDDLYVKIVYFIQRMIQSKGVEKVILHLGSRKAINELISVFNFHKKIVEKL